MKKILILLLGLFLIGCDDVKKPTLDVPEKEEIRYDQIDYVINYINLLPEEITLEDKNLILGIQKLYDELTEEEKKLVENYDTLEVAQKTILGLENEKEEYQEELKRIKEEILESIPSITDSSINLPTTYISKEGVVDISWKTTNPYTIRTNGTIIQGRVDETATLSALLSLNGETISLSKDITVKPIAFEPFESIENKVFAYMYSTSFDNYSEHDLKTINVVNLCFASISNGEVEPLSLGIVHPILAARSTTGIRVLLCITGYSSGGIPISDAAATEAGRKKFAASIVNMIEQYHYDGIDLDWEYPGFNTNRPISVDRVNYTLLMEEIYSQVKAKNQDYIVSGALPGGASTASRYELSKINNCMDFIHLMTYDMNSSSQTSHHTALRGARSVVAGVTHYLSNGVDQEKLVVGIAFYGKQFTVTGNGILGTSASYQSTIRYDHIAAYLRNDGDGNTTRYWDNNACAPYLYIASTKTFITYDDSESIKYKCQYTKEQNLGGVMFWEYGENKDKTLIKAIYENFK